IKKFSAKPSLAPQTGWSITPKSAARSTTPAAPRPPLLTRRGIPLQHISAVSAALDAPLNDSTLPHLIKNDLASNHCQNDLRVSDLFSVNVEDVLSENGEVRFLAGFECPYQFVTESGVS